MTTFAPILNRRFPSVAHREDAWRILLWLWAICCVVASSVGPFDSAEAQEVSDPNVRVSLVADREELTVGDLVTLTLEVTHPADHAVVLPRFGSDWGPFEVRSQTPARSVPAGDDDRTTHKQFQITIFAPGEYATPGLSLTVRTPDGSVSQVAAPTARLTVRSVLSGNDDALRDIRSPADLSENFWDRPEARVLVPLSAFAAFGVAAYLLYRRFRGEEPISELAMDTRTPLENADHELGRIERLDLPGNGRFKEHYTLVSAVLRAYLQGTYFDDPGGPDAEDMTTDEVAAALSLRSLDSKYCGLVRDLLLEADLVKYSSYAPQVSQAHEALARAREIVGEADTLQDDSPQGWSEAPA